MILSLGGNSKDHLQDLSSSHLRPFVDGFGGKAGGLEYLRAIPGLAPHILPGIYLDAADLESHTIHRHESYDPLVGVNILRSSTSTDGFADIGLWPSPNDTKLSGPDEDAQVLKLVEQFNSSRLTEAYFNTGLRYGQAGIGKHIFLRAYEYIQNPARVAELKKNITLTNPFGKIHALIDRFSSKAQIATNKSREYRLRRGLGDAHLGAYLQPFQKNLRYRGSIVEHPHHRGHYIVSGTAGTAGDDHTELYHSAVIGKENQIILHGNPIMHGTQGEYEKIVELYKEVAKQPLFSEHISFQMEFGVDRNGKTWIYQIRQFLPFEEASWKLDKHSNCVFGLAKDIAETVEYIHIGEFAKKQQTGKNQGILVGDYQTKSLLDPDLPLEEARSVLFSAGPGKVLHNRIHWNLEHDTYRAAMEGGIVILRDQIEIEELGSHTLRMNDGTFAKSGSLDGLREALDGLQREGAKKPFPKRKDAK